MATGEPIVEQLNSYINVLQEENIRLKTEVEKWAGRCSAAVEHEIKQNNQIHSLELQIGVLKDALADLLRTQGNVSLDDDPNSHASVYIRNGLKALKGEGIEKRKSKNDRG